tara:strand:- start:22855 stop:23703 length:849 start_codon:yes stop_codon:yes gene_type:complete
MSFKSKIGLGTVQFGLEYGINNIRGITSNIEIKKILNVLDSNKISLIDTAKAYGKSEMSLGLHDLSSFKIVSKYRPTLEFGTIENQLNDSLLKLKINSIYGYLAHDPISLLTNNLEWNDLNCLKKKGKIKKIGFSISKTSHLKKILEKGIIPDLIQVPYNYFDNRFEKYIKYLSLKGCEIHVRSIFLQGLFFSNINSLNKFFDPLIYDIDFLQKNYKNLSGELMNYASCNQYIDHIIIGVENSKQLIQNIEQLDNSLGLPIKKFNFPEKILDPFNWLNLIDD